MNSRIRSASLKNVEMGVCKDMPEGERCFLIPIDDSVRDNLESMLWTTYDQLEGQREDYELTQKYAAKENLVIRSSSPLSQRGRELYETTNIQTNSRALDDPSSVLYYFAFFRYRGGDKVLGVRRAAQFKVVLSARNRLVRMVDETLRVVDDPVFRLDLDFDYLVEPEEISIIRASGFEYTVSMAGYVEEAIESNIEELGRTIPFIDFESLTPFVQSHKRAARVVAALRSREDLARISKRKLVKMCRENNINLVNRRGVLSPAAGHEDSLLKLLDRRRYVISLIEDEYERYEAENRRTV